MMNIKGASVALQLSHQILQCNCQVFSVVLLYVCMAESSGFNASGRVLNASSIAFIFCSINGGTEDAMHFCCHVICMVYKDMILSALSMHHPSPYKQPIKPFKLNIASSSSI